MAAWSCVAVIELLKRNSLRCQFEPSLLGPWINPFYLARSGLYREVACLAPKISGALLDVGCGQKPYRALFEVDEYIGLELDTPENRARKLADCYYDGSRFPFEDARFDGIVCNQVLEHVFDPQGFLGELRRVLRPGGKLLLTVPFVWDEHEQPWDYARYTSFGLRDLLEAGGFTVLEQHKINADAGALLQLVNAYLYKVLHTRFAWLNLMACATLMAPVTLMGMLLAKLLPSNPDFYLDHVILAERSNDELQT